MAMAGVDKWLTPAEIEVICQHYTAPKTASMDVTHYTQFLADIETIFTQPVSDNERESLCVTVCLVDCHNNQRSSPCIACPGQSSRHTTRQVGVTSDDDSMAQHSMPAQHTTTTHTGVNPPAPLHAVQQQEVGCMQQKTPCVQRLSCPITYMFATHLNRLQPQLCPSAAHMYRSSSATR